MKLSSGCVQMNAFEQWFTLMVSAFQCCNKCQQKFGIFVTRLDSFFKVEKIKGPILCPIIKLYFKR